MECMVCGKKTDPVYFVGEVVSSVKKGAFVISQAHKVSKQEINMLCSKLCVIKLVDSVLDDWGDE